MCTAITLTTQQGETFFGRNMDFSYDIQPQLFIVPGGYVWNNVLDMSSLRNIYSFIGIGQALDGLLGFFDGVNEMGFTAAALYFAGYAQYENQPDQHSSAEQIASFDFLHYMLGRCASVDDLYALRGRVSILGIPDPVTGSAAPLHWIAADRNGRCAVIELTEKGFEIYDNSIGVMANSPDFPWHMTNLRNYMEASPYQTDETYWGDIKLTPFGQAAGTSILPGGYTSPERFVRTAYLKTHLPPTENDLDAVISCFHVMESVTIPRGAVVTNRETFDYTKYTAFINTITCEYYFKTYDNLQIRTASLYEVPSQPGQLINLGNLAMPMSFEKVGIQSR
ncbi:choloylglycine hydrolase family protein [Anoxybacterium hadale]|uniref:Choloylglycine hydrolase family protein n=1 Tax=Anoxybacterium hadale TaxID=3408580 RepID=A0ACD1ABV3_9FIRM|nr:choloylglycine hydrolase family protein [Clostridiales bacterium]